MKRVVIFIDLLTELIKVFSINLNAGSASMTTTINNGFFGKVESVGKIKITKTATRTFENVPF